MAVSMKDLGIDRLDVAERLALVQEIWESIADDVANRPLPEGFLAEIDRRLAAHEANPGAAIPYEQVKAQALARIRKS